MGLPASELEIRRLYYRDKKLPQLRWMLHQAVALIHARARAAHQTADSVLTSSARDMVVDLGCGKGDLTLLLAAALPTWRILGVDTNPDAIGSASSRAHAAGLANVSFRIADAAQLEKIAADVRSADDYANDCAVPHYSARCARSGSWRRTPCPDLQLHHHFHPYLHLRSGGAPPIFDGCSLIVGLRACGDPPTASPCAFFDCHCLFTISARISMRSRWALGRSAAPRGALWRLMPDRNMLLRQASPLVSRCALGTARRGRQGGPLSDGRFRGSRGKFIMSWKLHMDMDIDTSMGGKADMDVFRGPLPYLPTQTPRPGVGRGATCGEQPKAERAARRYSTQRAGAAGASDDAYLPRGFLEAECGTWCGAPMWHMQGRLSEATHRYTLMVDAPDCLL